MVTALGGSAARLAQVSPDLADDYMTLQLLAAGLQQIQHRRRQDPWRTGPREQGLPSAWIAGVRRLWWRALEQGFVGLGSHQDVFRWCRQPLGEWPIPLSVTPSDVELVLIEDGEPSAFADQAGRLVLAKDPEAELVENRCFDLLITSAERNATSEEQVQHNYAVLREFFIEHPVVSDLDLAGLLRRFPAAGPHGMPWVKELFLLAYRALSVSGGVAVVKVCGGCGNPLDDGQPRCGTAGCQGHPETLEVRALGFVYLQHRAVRRFIHDPGLAERRVLQALRAVLGLLVVPWWGMDAVDVAIDFDGTGVMGKGEWWAADVKDHASAALLGRNFRWDARASAARRFLVLPEHRFRQFCYLDDLTRELEGRVKGVEVISEQRFIDDVLARARRGY